MREIARESCRLFGLGTSAAVVAALPTGTRVVRRGRAFELLGRVVAVAVVVVAVAPALAFGASRQLVVDRDGVQCPNAGFTSIQAAVDAADAGDVVRVCPDVYRETVRVEKALMLRGEPDAAEAVDCFDPRASQLSDADPTRQVIVEGGRSPAPPLFDLAADGIELKGFVLQGAYSETAGDYTPAINTSDRFSGYRISHNVVRLSKVGIQFGSSGRDGSRFDHNCLRENGWDLATDDRKLADARVDHNATFKTTFIAFEPLNGRIERVTFDHNASRETGFYAYWVQNSSDSRIIANTVESAAFGVRVGGLAPSVALEISRNRITNPPGGRAQTGIQFDSGSTAPSREVAVLENTITGMVFTGIVARGGPVDPAPSVINSEFSRNVTSGNGLDGIALWGGNAGNVVRANLAERNGRYGIYARGAINTLFADNTMLGNGANPTSGGVDARDLLRESNRWTGNECLTDLPVGTICGIRQP